MLAFFDPLTGWSGKSVARIQSKINFGSNCDYFDPNIDQSRITIDTRIWIDYSRSQLDSEIGYYKRQCIN